MARNDATVLTEDGFRKLRRMYYDQQRQLRNLTRSLSTLTVKRHQGPTHKPPRVRFKNTSGELVPAFAVMRITSGGSKDCLAISKPDATYRWLYLVNGPRQVAIGGYGTGHFLTAETFTPKRNFVLHDTGSTPSIGQEWGPKDGSWLLWQHRPGFLIVGVTTGNGSGAVNRVQCLQQSPGEILVYNATGSPIGAGASGTATLYGGVAGSEATLGLTVTAYNRSSTSWANAKYGMADLINGQVYVSPQQT